MRISVSGAKALGRMVVATSLSIHWLCHSLFPPISSAVLNSPKAELPRTPEAALRRSIPSFNSDVKEIQVNTRYFILIFYKCPLEVDGGHIWVHEDPSKEAVAINGTERSVGPISAQQQESDP